MAVARILVDGYSLLHHWKDLAPGKPRHSDAARDELVHQITKYADASGTPVTIVFDGAGPRRESDALPSSPEVEVIYTRAGQSADQLIERVTHKMKPYGEVLVVTDDVAERDTVEAAGALISSCANFIQTLEATVAEIDRKIKNINQRESLKFKSK